MIFNWPQGFFRGLALNTHQCRLRDFYPQITVVLSKGKDAMGQSSQISVSLLQIISILRGEQKIQIVKKSSHLIPTPLFLLSLYIKLKKYVIALCYGTVQCPTFVQYQHYKVLLYCTVWVHHTVQCLTLLYIIGYLSISTLLYSKTKCKYAVPYSTRCTVQYFF